MSDNNSNTRLLETSVGAIVGSALARPYPSDREAVRHVQAAVTPLIAVGLQRVAAYLQAQTTIPTDQQIRDAFVSGVIFGNHGGA